MRMDGVQQALATNLAVGDEVMCVTAPEFSRSISVGDPLRCGSGYVTCATGYVPAVAGVSQVRRVPIAPVSASTETADPIVLDPRDRTLTSRTVTSLVGPYGAHVRSTDALNCRGGSISRMAFRGMRLDDALVQMSGTVIADNGQGRVFDTSPETRDIAMEAGSEFLTDKVVFGHHSDWVVCNLSASETADRSSR